MSNNGQRGFTIRIFFPDGDPDGLRILSKANWSGTGVVFRRTGYGEAKKNINRGEFNQNGVYVLVGAVEDSTLPMIYIGEGDPVLERFDNHNRKKDFWEWAVFFVSADNSLNKAHFKYLESRLLGLASLAKQCKLDNTSSSYPPTLSEPETADTEQFLENMLSFFPLLGVDIFQTPPTAKPSQALLYIKNQDIEATGYEDSKGFVVCAGSMASKNETATIPSNAKTLRQDLQSQKILSDDGRVLNFTQNQLFGSPSAAAAVVLGCSVNGRMAWKNSEDISLKQLQSIASGAEIEED